NHEHYFAQLEKAPSELPTDSDLYQNITDQFGSFEGWLDGFKKLGMTRGIGWAMLYADRSTGRLINHWIDEQHLGHLTGLKPVVALDMWEHSFMLDYPPSEKKNYIEAFFASLNLKAVEEMYHKER